MNDVLAVFLAALVTALATGLGALPFVFVPDMGRRWLGISNAIAAGFMLSASGALLIEGLIRGVWRVLAGAAVGAIFIAATHRLITGQENLQLGRLRSADARKAILIIGVMTLHSLSEGVGLGVSFGGGAELGLFITIAIAIHNIPEGLAISLSRSSRRSPTCSWSRSARSCRSGSASPRARWRGSSSASSCRTRERSLRRGRFSAGSAARWP